jgi:hypothetical protein
MTNVIAILKHPLMGAAGTLTSLLAALHVVNVCLGVAGAVLAVAAGWYHLRVKYAEWKKLRDGK